MTDYLRLAQERAPQSLEPQDNPYLPLAQQAQALGQNRARTVIETALRDDPDIAAERQRLSRTSGVPLNVVERNLEELRIKERARAVDLVTLAQESPVLYRQIADPTFTTTSIDDLDTLKNIERTIGSATAYAMGAKPDGGLATDAVGLAKDVGLGATVGVGRMMFNLAGTVNDLIGWKSGAEAARAQANRAQESMNFFGSQGQSSTAQAVRSGAQSAGQNLALLPLGLSRQLFATANQAAAAVAGAMSAGVGADAYLTAREKGRTQVQALGYAIPEAAFEYVFERIPASKLFGDIAANTGLLKTIGKQTVSEGWTEQVTTLAQDFNEWMNLNPDKTIGQFIQERPEAAYQTFIATLVGVGVQTSTIKGINKVIEQASNQALSFEQDRLQQQMALASQSLLRQRSPEQFRAHVEQVVEANPDTPQQIYVDAEVLNQLPQEVLAQLPETVRAQIPEALDTNSTVAISMADVLTVAPGTELEQVLNDNARMRPNASSRVEAQLAAEMIQQEADRVLAQAADQTAWQQSTQAVQQTILDQLTATGRFSADVNQAYATLQSAFFSTMAARSGTTPEQFYQDWSLKVANAQQAGQVLNAEAPLVVFDEALLEVAKRDTAALRGMASYDLQEDVQGVLPGKLRALDRSLQKGLYTEDDIAQAFQSTRDALRQRYGERLTLWRADAPEAEQNADTRTVFMADENTARKFAENGREAKAYSVSVDDVLAVNALPNGYYEVIARKSAMSQPVFNQTPGALPIWSLERAKGARITDTVKKAAIALAPTATQARKNYDKLDAIFAKVPDPLASEEAWRKFMSLLVADRDVLGVPYNALKYAQPAPRPARLAPRRL
jgi:Large polyvalent protein associated domain 22